jgi:hypothetical protein
LGPIRVTPTSEKLPIKIYSKSFLGNAIDRAPASMNFKLMRAETLIAINAKKPRTTPIKISNPCMVKDVHIGLKNTEVDNGGKIKVKNEW